MVKRIVLTADQILNADDLEKEWVPIPEWLGGNEDAGVYVRTLTANERDKFEDAITKVEGKETTVVMLGMRAHLASMASVNEDSEPVFTAEQMEALGQKSAIPLDRIFGVAQRLCGMTDKDVEDLAKNSVAAQQDDSPTNSPEK